MQEHIIRNLFKIDKLEILISDSKEINKKDGEKIENKNLSNILNNEPNPQKMTGSNALGPLGASDRSNLNFSSETPTRSKGKNKLFFRKEKSIDIPMRNLEEKKINESISTKILKEISYLNSSFSYLKKPTNYSTADNEKKKKILKKLETLKMMDEGKIKTHHRDKFLFSLIDNLIMKLCCCKTTKLKKFDELFKKLYNYSISYTDVLTIAKKFNEIDKLKFLLFNEKQIALFNLKGNIKNPYGIKKNKMTELFIYNHDGESQKNNLEDFLQSLKNGQEASAIDRKLIDLCSEDIEQ
jgi:hypothetical protein